MGGAEFECNTKADDVVSEYAESVVNLLQWVHINPDHSADGQYTLRVPFQTVVTLRVHWVADGEERRSADMAYCLRLFGSMGASSGRRWFLCGCEGGEDGETAFFCWNVTGEPLHNTKLHLTRI